MRIGNIRIPSHNFLLTILVFASLLSMAIITAPPTEAREDGVANTSLGCVCHSGKATESVGVTLSGLPENYSAGDVVNLTVTITGGPDVGEQNGQEIAQGGFNLHVTGGVLSPVNDSAVRIVDNQATHKTAGKDRKEWRVVWTAPQVESELVTFTLTGNAVNGDGKADNADQWNQAKYEVPGVKYGEEKSIPSLGFVAGVAVLGLAAVSLAAVGGVRRRAL